MVPDEKAAKDRVLVPTYPGISDAKSLGEWDPPFPIELATDPPEGRGLLEEIRSLAQGVSRHRHRARALRRIGQPAHDPARCRPERSRRSARRARSAARRRLSVHGSRPRLRERRVQRPRLRRVLRGLFRPADHVRPARGRRVRAFPLRDPLARTRRASDVRLDRGRCAPTLHHRGLGALRSGGSPGSDPGTPGLDGSSADPAPGVGSRGFRIACPRDHGVAGHEHGAWICPQPRRPGPGPARHLEARTLGSPPEP